MGSVIQTLVGHMGDMIATDTFKSVVDVKRVFPGDPGSYVAPDDYPFMFVKLTSMENTDGSIGAIDFDRHAEITIVMNEMDVNVDNYFGDPSAVILENASILIVKWLSDKRRQIDFMPGSRGVEDIRVRFDDDFEGGTTRSATVELTVRTGHSYDFVLE